MTVCAFAPASVISGTRRNFKLLCSQSRSPAWPAPGTVLNSICLYINNQPKLQGLYSLFLNSSGPSLYIPKRLSKYFTDNTKANFTEPRLIYHKFMESKGTVVFVLYNL